MPATVGPGIAQAMADAQDQPMTNEWTELHGPAKVVKAYGKSGYLYVASDDSGDWIATRVPFAEG